MGRFTAELSTLLSLEDSDISVSIAELSSNAPLLYVNKAFERMTLYNRDSVIGRNCRFLQGENTDTEAVKMLRKAIFERRFDGVCLQNYRSNGDPFHNLIVVAPIQVSRDTQWVVASQFDITQPLRAHRLEQHLERVSGFVDQLKPVERDAWAGTLEHTYAVADSIALRTRQYFRMQSIR